MPFPFASPQKCILFHRKSTHGIWIKVFSLIFCVWISSSSAFVIRTPNTRKTKLHTTRWSAFIEPACTFSLSLLPSSLPDIHPWSTSFSLWNLCNNASIWFAPRAMRCCHASSMQQLPVCDALLLLFFFSCLQSLGSASIAACAIRFLSTLSDSRRNDSSFRSISSLIFRLSSLAAVLPVCRFILLSWMLCILCDLSALFHASFRKVGKSEFSWKCFPKNSYYRSCSWSFSRNFQLRTRSLKFGFLHEN